ncbi:hypothetical protein VCR5J5_240393 [Vibrio crassostreae]|uniref:Uncharacterized protein n=1 Tax=Vibrio crassostreae TaxID=246167 RepID=A0A822N0X0_9VIBR|nr:hypothetical protein VCR5J5_240393 [Vibrio crassostreae]
MIGMTHGLFVRLTKHLINRS